jgi:hypothetical protein
MGLHFTGNTMDFQQYDTVDATPKSKSKASIVPSSSGGMVGNSGKSGGLKIVQSGKFQAGLVKTSDASSMIPAAVAQSLSLVAKKYGLNFEPGNLTLQEITPEKIKHLREMVDILKSNAKFIPELIALVKQVHKLDIDMAKFNKEVVKIGLKHGEAINKEMADIFLMMGKAEAKTNKLTAITNVRAEIRDKKTTAEINFYQGSVLGSAMEVIDAQEKMWVSNKATQTELKKAKIGNKQERVKQQTEYQKQAY